MWGDPNRELLATIAELNSVIAAKTPNETKAKRSDMLRIPRPGDGAKKRKRIGAGSAMPIGELDAWLAGDFTPVDDEEAFGGKKELPPS